MNIYTKDGSLPLRGVVLLREQILYGQQMLYPANELARGLTALTRASTVPMPTVQRMKALGLRVRTVGFAAREL